MTKIAFIGAGNMNRAIIMGLINDGVDSKSIMVTNPSPEKRMALAEEFGILQTNDNLEAATFADMIVLGVKPHFITQVCQQISQAMDVSKKCFISIAAGTTITQIQTALAGKFSVVRTMPNTPSQLGLGMTGIIASPEVSKSQKETTDTLMKAVGKVIWLEQETQIDDITSISGSGPAYFFLFMEAMEKQAQAIGFSAEDSRMLVQQTALGATQMVVHNDLPIAQLRNNVCSKGGTTQAAVDQFIADDIQQMVTNSMNAALHRAREMAQNNS
jgi:pyrroline-5-carboxylate reductase